MVVISLLRSGSIEEISFEKCGIIDWATVGIFFITMWIVVYYSVKTTKKEQELKTKYGHINLVPSDLIFKGKVLRNVLILGFGGGWVAGALGLGGGVIFNPLLLSMGVPPKVSSATGMYLITFSKIVTTMLYVIFGQLLLDYGLWIAFWSSIGAIIGLKGANWYMKKFNRQSIIVFFLAFVLLLSTLGVPYFGIKDLMKKESIGEDIYSFKSICK